jgi:hypothetical protein
VSSVPTGGRFLPIDANCYISLTRRIVAALSIEERGMFRERIKNLDKKLQPGLTKLTWATRGVSEFFIQECRVQAAKVTIDSCCLKLTFPRPRPFEAHEYS